MNECKLYIYEIFEVKDGWSWHVFDADYVNLDGTLSHHGDVLEEGEVFISESVATIDCWQTLERSTKYELLFDTFELGSFIISLIQDLDAIAGWDEDHGLMIRYKGV